MDVSLLVIFPDISVPLIIQILSWIFSLDSLFSCRDWVGCCSAHCRRGTGEFTGDGTSAGGTGGGDGDGGSLHSCSQCDRFVTWARLRINECWILWGVHEQAAIISTNESDVSKVAECQRGRNSCRKFIVVHFWYWPGLAESIFCWKIIFSR